MATKRLLVILSQVAILVHFTANPVLAAGCTRESDNAGRWRDSLSPAGRIKDMCNNRYTEHKATRGRMVITNMNTRDCSAAYRFALERQSWRNDWFLWNRISCSNGMQIGIY